MSKDTDVKAYIFHPLTKRWEGLLFTNASAENTSDGIACFPTSEGLVILTGTNNVVDNYPAVTGGSYPNFLIYIDNLKTALSISYNGQSKEII